MNIADRLFHIGGGDRKRSGQCDPEMPKVRFPQEQDLNGGLYIAPNVLKELIGDCEEKTGKEKRLYLLA